MRGLFFFQWILLITKYRWSGVLVKRADPQILSFFSSLPFFLCSVSPVAEPKITEESSSGEQRSGQRGSTPPGAPSLFFPSVIHQWNTLKTRFCLPIRLVISKNYHKNQDGVRCQLLLRGNSEPQVNWEAFEQFNMIRMRIMQTRYTTEIWSITSLNYGRAHPQHPIIWLRICFAIKGARFVHN